MTQHKWGPCSEDEWERFLKYWGQIGRIQVFAKCLRCGLVRRTAGAIKRERVYTRTDWATIYYKAPKCEVPR
jgi:hypothetical protein